MASSITLTTIQGPLLRSHFLGETLFYGNQKSSFTAPKQPLIFHLRPCAKFDLFQIMGGRGLCNGEIGLQQELKRNRERASSPAATEQGQEQEQDGEVGKSTLNDDVENAFEKELMGLTGGFPGGEKGLKKFIEQNPPPKNTPVSNSGNVPALPSSKKSKPP